MPRIVQKEHMCVKRFIAGKGGESCRYRLQESLHRRARVSVIERVCSSAVEQGTHNLNERL
jgi:hypothetical protein